MAKTTPPTVINVPAVIDAAPTRTPENTPIPGGGSWHWDTTLANWVPNLPDATTTTPTQE